MSSTANTPAAPDEPPAPMVAFSRETIQLFADSIGIPNLSDNILDSLGQEVCSRVHAVLYEANRFKTIFKQTSLTHEAVEAALKNMYNTGNSMSMGILPRGALYRQAFLGAGKDFHYSEGEAPVNFHSNPAEPVPIAGEVGLRSHWLAIDGIQPIIPENPSPLERDTADSHNAPVKDSVAPSQAKPSQATVTQARKRAAKAVGGTISIEQQVYFKEITESCVLDSVPEAKRLDALASLRADPGLQPLLPRLVAFIVEGVRFNLCKSKNHRNIPGTPSPFVVLSRVLGIVASLSQNPHIILTSFLHHLIPACLSCAVFQHISIDDDNHWTVRKLASCQVAQLTSKFDCQTSGAIRRRVTQTCVASVEELISTEETTDDENPESASQNTIAIDIGRLLAAYGSLDILYAFGEDTTFNVVLPLLSRLGDRLERIANSIEDPSVDYVLEKICQGFTALVQPCRTKFGKSVLSDESRCFEILETNFGRFITSRLLPLLVK